MRRKLRKIIVRTGRYPHGTLMFKRYQIFDIIPVICRKLEHPWIYLRSSVDSIDRWPQPIEKNANHRQVIQSRVNFRMSSTVNMLSCLAEDLCRLPKWRRKLRKIVIGTGRFPHGSLMSKKYQTFDRRPVICRKLEHPWAYLRSSVDSIDRWPATCRKKRKSSTGHSR